MDILNKLATMDDLRKVRISNFHAAIHTSHRWTLALIYYAQEKGYIDKPCKLISFDSHADSLKPICFEKIDNMSKNGFDGEDIVELCSGSLSKRNDDWIRAAMRLGLVSDAVVFGFHDSQSNGFQIKDINCKEHWLWTCSMPGYELRYQGVLGDQCKRNELCAQSMWDILNWEIKKGRLGFKTSKSKLFMSIDLDCFMIKWMEYQFPWPDEVYEVEFNEQDKNSKWSGGEFCDNIISNMGFLDIAEEPGCCGGPEKSKKIFEDMNKYMFKNKLKIVP